MIKSIIHELKHHTPFTLLGVFVGVVLMIILKDLPRKTAFTVFYTLHPLHVFLSALVTASMYSLHKCGKFKIKCSIWMLLGVGYVGSIGIATLSDSVIPYLGEIMLDLPHREVHLGFIEKWWLINPMAIAGIIIAYYKPTTKFPHFGHVFISTWASIFHVLMAKEGIVGVSEYFIICGFLFLSVWIPCCVSDIIFPLLFIKDEPKI